MTDFQLNFFKLTKGHIFSHIHLAYLGYQRVKIPTLRAYAIYYGTRARALKTCYSYIEVTLITNESLIIHMVKQGSYSKHTF